MEEHFAPTRMTSFASPQVTSHAWLSLATGSVETKRGSGRHAHVVVQELGRQIRAVRPREGVKLRVELELSEQSQIAKRLEHRAVKFFLEVDLPCRLIAEPQPDDI